METQQQGGVRIGQPSQAQQQPLLHSPAGSDVSISNKAAAAVKLVTQDGVQYIQSGGVGPAVSQQQGYPPGLLRRTPSSANVVTGAPPSVRPAQQQYRPLQPGQPILRRIDGRPSLAQTVRSFLPQQFQQQFKQQPRPYAQGNIPGAVRLPGPTQLGQQSFTPRAPPQQYINNPGTPNTFNGPLRNPDYSQGLRPPGPPPAGLLRPHYQGVGGPSPLRPYFAGPPQQQQHQQNAVPPQSVIAQSNNGDVPSTVSSGMGGEGSRLQQEGKNKPNRSFSTGVIGSDKTVSQIEEEQRRRSIAGFNRPAAPGESIAQGRGEIKRQQSAVFSFVKGKLQQSLENKQGLLRRMDSTPEVPRMDASRNGSASANGVKPVISGAAVHAAAGSIETADAMPSPAPVQQPKPTVVEDDSKTRGEEVKKSLEKEDLGRPVSREEDKVLGSDDKRVSSSTPVKRPSETEKLDGSPKTVKDSTELLPKSEIIIPKAEIVGKKTEDAVKSEVLSVNGHVPESEPAFGKEETKDEPKQVEKSVTDAKVPLSAASALVNGIDSIENVPTAKEMPTTSPIPKAVSPIVNGEIKDSLQLTSRTVDAGKEDETDDDNDVVVLRKDTELNSKGASSSLSSLDDVVTPKSSKEHIPVSPKIDPMKEKEVRSSDLDTKLTGKEVKADALGTYSVENLPKATNDVTGKSKSPEPATKTATEVDKSKTAEHVIEVDVSKSTEPSTVALESKTVETLEPSQDKVEKPEKLEVAKSADKYEPSEPKEKAKTPDLRHSTDLAATTAKAESPIPTLKPEISQVSEPAPVAEKSKTPESSLVTEKPGTPEPTLAVEEPEKPKLSPEPVPSVEKSKAPESVILKTPEPSVSDEKPKTSGSALATEKPRIPESSPVVNDKNGPKSSMDKPKTEEPAPVVDKSKSPDPASVLEKSQSPEPVPTIDMSKPESPQRSATPEVLAEALPSVDKPKTPGLAVGKTESPEPPAAVEKAKSPEPSAAVEKSKSPEPSTAVEKPKTPEPSAAIEKPKTPEPSAAVEKPKTPEPSAAVEKPKTPEPSAAAEKPTKPESTAVVEKPKTPEPAYAADKPKSFEPAPTVKKTSESPESVSPAVTSKSPELPSVVDGSKSPESAPVIQKPETPEPSSDIDKSKVPETAVEIPKTPEPLADEEPSIPPEPTVKTTPPMEAREKSKSPSPIKSLTPEDRGSKTQTPEPEVVPSERTASSPKDVATDEVQKRQDLSSDKSPVSTTDINAEAKTKSDVGDETKQLIFESKLSENLKFETKSMEEAEIKDIKEVVAEDEKEKEAIPSAEESPSKLDTAHVESPKEAIKPQEEISEVLEKEVKDPISEDHIQKEEKQKQELDSTVSDDKKVIPKKLDVEDKQQKLSKEGVKKSRSPSRPGSVLPRVPTPKKLPPSTKSTTDSEDEKSPKSKIAPQKKGSSTDEEEPIITPKKRPTKKRPKEEVAKKQEGDHDSGVDESTQGNETITTNGVLGSPSKSPSKIPSPKKQAVTSPTKTPLKSPIKTSAKSTPRTPETAASTAATQPEKKKVPMNKVQVGAAPSPNLKTVRSKIGSLDNASYKPGGGKVKIEHRKLDFSKTQPKIAAKNETYVPGGGDKKITQVKLQWNAKPKVGSLENATHKPGGGDKKIESVKLDFKDKAKPKIGSKDNVKHVPGGGSVKTTPSSQEGTSTSDIENQKTDFKAQSKVGSLANVKHKPGGGDVKIFDDKSYLKQVSGGASSIASSEGRASGTQSPLLLHSPSQALSETGSHHEDS